MKSRSRRRKSKSRSKSSKKQTRSRSKQLRTRASIRKKSKSRKINIYKSMNRGKTHQIGRKRYDRPSPQLIIKSIEYSGPYFVTTNDKYIDKNNSYIPSFQELYIEYPHNTRVYPSHPFLKDPNHKIIYELFNDGGVLEIIVQTSRKVSLYKRIHSDNDDDRYNLIRQSSYQAVLPGIDMPEDYKKWNRESNTYTIIPGKPRHGNKVMIDFGKGRYETFITGSHHFSSPVTHFYSIIHRNAGYPFWFTKDGWVYRFMGSVYRSKNSKYNNSPESILSLNVDDNPVWGEDFEDNKIPYGKTSFFD